MKTKTTEDLTDDLRPHYDFDYGKMKRNRFAGMKLSAPIYLNSLPGNALLKTRSPQRHRGHRAL